MAGPPGKPTAATRVYALSLRQATPDSHEYLTLDWIARQAARLCGLSYAGVQRLEEAGPGFAVPDDTLTTAQAAALRLADAQLLGGVVPHAFVATKAISHPLVAPAADAPPGWEPVPRIERTTLPGHTVFSPADARLACERLMPLGPLRAKAAADRGGHGQRVLRTPDDCAAFARGADADGMLRSHGMVLELDLPHARSYSIGEVTLAGLRIAYAGRQYDTRDAHGGRVYGGSSLMATRGGMESLAGRARTPAMRTAVALACAYDAAVRAAYPGIVRTRCNYDVVIGMDARGQPRAGVLEQSWRVGGATPAELGALEAFLQDPTLARALASTRERHGPAWLPRDADIVCRMHDARCGPITKYRTLRFHGSQAQDA